MFQACFDACPFPATPVPDRYSDGQDSLFRRGLIINLTWPRKRQENSKLISFWILQRVFTSMFRKNVRWRQIVRSYLAFYVSSCPNNEDECRKDLPKGILVGGGGEGGYRRHALTKLYYFTRTNFSM